MPSVAATMTERGTPFGAGRRPPEARRHARWSAAALLAPASAAVFAGTVGWASDNQPSFDSAKTPVTQASDPEDQHAETSPDSEASPDAELEHEIRAQIAQVEAMRERVAALRRQVAQLRGQAAAADGSTRTTTSTARSTAGTTARTATARKTTRAPAATTKAPAPKTTRAPATSATTGGS